MALLCQSIPEKFLLDCFYPRCPGNAVSNYEKETELVATHCLKTVATLVRYRGAVANTKEQVLLASPDGVTTLRNCRRSSVQSESLEDLFSSKTSDVKISALCGC